MASSFGSPSLLVLLLVLLSSSLSLSSPTLSSKVTSALLNEICYESRNPSLCLRVLKSNPKTSTTDLNGLCYISFELTGHYGTDTWKILDKLVKRTSDPQLKHRFKSCLMNYDVALYEVTNALELFKESHPDTNAIRFAASTIMSQVAECDANFEGPPAEPAASLLVRNTYLSDLSSIIPCIADLMTLQH